MTKAEQQKKLGSRKEKVKGKRKSIKKKKKGPAYRIDTYDTDKKGKGKNTFGVIRHIFLANVNKFI